MNRKGFVRLRQVQLLTEEHWGPCAFFVALSLLSDTVLLLLFSSVRLLE